MWRLVTGTGEQPWSRAERRAQRRRARWHSAGRGRHHVPRSHTGRCL